jgi:hypothetical protein
MLLYPFTFTLLNLNVQIIKCYEQFDFMFSTIFFTAFFSKLYFKSSTVENSFFFQYAEWLQIVLRKLHNMFAGSKRIKIVSIGRSLLCSKRRWWCENSILSRRHSVTWKSTSVKFMWQSPKFIAIFKVFAFIVSLHISKNLHHHHNNNFN